MLKFDEKSLVEDYFDKELQNKGWKPVPADSLERESLEEPLLIANLTRAIKKLNTNPTVGDEELRQALTELKLGKPEQALHYLKNGIPVKFEKDRAVYNIRLFDYNNITNNEFTLSRQVIHQSGNKQIRNDIVLYVNGIPLVNIECKNPASLTETWHNAYQQIRDYATTTPELYKYVQTGIATEQTAKYFPVMPWTQQEETKIHQWRTPDKPDPIDATIEMLTPATLLNIIRNYLFFRIEHGQTTKVIARYMQYRAAERIYNRAIDHLKGKNTKNKGLIWHWQGSGKTLTMIFAANKLFHDPTLANPTILFTVDREDLQEQLYTEYTALDLQPKPEIANNIHELKRILTHDEGKGKRGIFIALIQKWRPEEFQQLQKDLQKLSQTEETILTRKNVIVFIDEGHRTQYGTLAGQMNLILKNAQKFAFTGTPIAIGQRNTYDQFSYPPQEPYLDKYFITDAIQDGFTVKLTYQSHLENQHLKKDMLDFLLQLGIEEIPEQYREPTKKGVKKRLNTVNVYLENENRITIKATDIAKHFKENVDGKFKALVVAASRKACVIYKRELDKLLPPEYSEVVMTYGRGDKPPIPEYEKQLITRFNGKEIRDTTKEIIEKYKEQTLPKILIVTDMLLTGFDAPILQTMYLDKFLRGHRLLQAAARTNRPYKDLKEAGLIIDYVGMLKEFHKAFENYTKEDITGVLINPEELRQQFNQLLNETLKLFETIPRNEPAWQIMRKTIHHLATNEQKAKQFQENYKLLRKLFELLGPDTIKVERLSDYIFLSKIYILYMREIIGRNPIQEKYVQEYFRKTLNYVYKTTEIEEIQKQSPIIEFDENYLKNLEDKIKNKEEKAANIVFTLNRYVLVHKEENPIYESLADRVQRILDHWKKRTKNNETIIAEGTQIISEYAKLEDRKKQLDFTDLQYALLLTLEKQFPTNTTLTQDTKELTSKLKPLMFKDWQTQPTARKNIEREVRTYTRKYIKQHNLKMDQFEQLYEKMMQNVKTYAKT